MAYLFLSVEPAAPRLHLIERRLRDLEKQEMSSSPFVQAMRSDFGGSRLISVIKDSTERVIRLNFSIEDESGKSSTLTLVAQLTGRSANLLILNNEGRITQALRPPQGKGQTIGELYQPPPARDATPDRQRESGLSEQLKKDAFSSLSAAIDDYYLRRETAETFARRVKTLQRKLKRELAQSAKLETNLKKDLAAHGDSEQHKRMGDLLLANIATAQRHGNTVTLKDYYAEGAPNFKIDVDKETSLQDEAARYFARYRKAKRAAKEISKRLAQIGETAARLKARQAELERIIASGDDEALELLEGSRETVVSKKGKSKPAEKIPGVRRYQSSDGYEVLVGRAAHTNDHLTFRVARPHDWWLHAADYPGSHVVIRNHARGEIPHRTIIEAAQLAAKFSQAGDDSKVTIHYTQRKFLSKPKGAAPGLVRMSTFRSIVVKPGENIPRISTHPKAKQT